MVLFGKARGQTDTLPSLSFLTSASHTKLEVRRILGPHYRSPSPDQGRGSYDRKMMEVASWGHSQAGDRTEGQGKGPFSKQMELIPERGSAVRQASLESTEKSVSGKIGFICMHVNGCSSI